MIRQRHLGLILCCVFAIGWGAESSQAGFLSAREARKTPRARIACLPSPTMGVRYIGSDDLGTHAFRSGRSEGKGILYTCHGGHIDVTHLRKIADWTAYLAYHMRDALVRDQSEFVFKMFEPSRHHVRVEYPPGWRYLDDEAKRQIAGEVSICMGEYLAYTASVWHEILTWHGFKAIGFYPEYNSAFSWEDNYSNALGSYIGGLALRDRDRTYNEAMTLLVNRELDRLGVQSKERAHQAGEAVRGSWFVGAFIRVTMTKRHLDIGLDDGFITPWLVPDAAGCDAPQPWLCPAPTLRLLEDYGFRIGHEIEPREWEKYKILRAVYPNRKERRNRIDPVKHFPVIMEHVRAKANKRYGPFAHLRQAPTAIPGQRQLAKGTRRTSNRSGTNLPAHQAGLVRTTQDSLDDAPAQNDSPENRRPNLLGFLGSAVSWLTDGAP